MIHIRLEEELSVSKLVGLGRGRRTLALTALTVSLAAAPALAQEVPAGAGGEKSSSGGEHRVRRGDTLWDLARHYLNDPFSWGRIYDANREVVSNPHLIYPNDRLVIPGLGVAEKGSGAAAADATQVAGGQRRTIFYQAGSAGADGAARSDSDQPTFVEGEKMRTLAVQPAEYLAAPWLAESDTLPAYGTVLRVLGHGDGSDRIARTVHPGDRLYIRRQGRAAPEPGAEILLANEGRRVRGWGRIVAPTGVAVVEEVDRDVIIVRVSKQFYQVRPGDLALPFVEPPEVEGELEPVEDGVAGTIIGFDFEQPAYGTAELGFVDLGSRSGVGVGDELEVIIPSGEEGGFSQRRIPEQGVARLRVIRVEDRTATVRVTDVRYSQLRQGLPVRLVGKMP